VHVSVDYLLESSLSPCLRKPPSECLQSGTYFDRLVRIEKEVLYFIKVKWSQRLLHTTVIIVLLNLLFVIDLLLLCLLILVLLLLIELTSIQTKSILKLSLHRLHFVVEGIVSSL
jgi:hypothetical protein